MEFHHNAVEIIDFHKRYNEKYAVHGLDLTVKSGTFFGFVGPNGAGKTTTINAIVGMIKPTSGSIRVSGYDVSKNPLEVKARVGFMPEETVLYERLTAKEYLEFSGKLYGLEPEVIKKRTAELLELLDLSGDQFTGTFSHGMKKKVALAAAMIHRPALIVLDEPFSGIDATTASRIRKALNEMVDNGHTVFFSSHVLETVERISREIGVIHKGRLLATGSLKEVREIACCAPDSSLEEIFLTLVGAQEVKPQGE